MLFLFKILHNVVAHPILLLPWEWTTRFHDWTALWAFEPDAACVLHVREDGKVLAVCRPHTMDQWGLPGGKVDPGETSDFAAGRELFEEACVRPGKLKEFYRGYANGKLAVTYATDEILGEPSRGDAGPVDYVEWHYLTSGPFGAYNEKVRQKWMQ